MSNVPFALNATPSALSTIRRLRDLAGALGIAHELFRHDRWSPAQLHAFQRRRLWSLVRYAMEHAPFYRDLYERVPPSGAIDLEQLPIVSKALTALLRLRSFDRTGPVEPPRSAPGGFSLSGAGGRT